ncbi:hypothetical protein DL98DRAFT_604733 [Cadophora sp. DSE1049]|nr:hypothetical protein DL98DRAFT_604733 [Cadophora sp. DSE1049]
MFLLAVILLLSSLAIQVKATCYNLDGAFEPSAFPCGTSSNDCCNAGDFCTSVNGLCLNVGGNNFLTNLACGNQDWSGCTKYCQSRKSNIVMLCDPGGNDGKAQNYCCSDGHTDCCSETSSWSSIPVFATVFRPGATVSTGTATTATPTSSSGSTMTTPPTNTNPPPPSPDKSDNSLAIGLGVGISLGVALVACLVYIIWQRRRARISGTSSSKHADFQSGNQPQVYVDREEVVKAPPYQGRSELDARGLMELPDGQTTGPRGGLR